jgi:hypothetical protein
MSSKRSRERYSDTESASCRSCSLNYGLTMKTGSHELIDVGMFCPLCKFSGQSICHGEHDSLRGTSFECNQCHNYIMYFDNGLLIKDELYFEKGLGLIRDIEDCVSCLLVYNDLAIVIPGLIDASDPVKLFLKLKTYLVFS